MVFTYNCIFTRWVKRASTTSPLIHTNSFDPTLILLRLFIFGWKLEQTYNCLVPKRFIACTPTFWYTAIFPASSYMSVKPPEVEDSVRFWLTKLISTWQQFLIAIQNMSQACSFIKNETMAQVFSCEFCKISKGEDTLWNISFRCLIKRNLMQITLHLILFHEICITYVKRKPHEPSYAKNAISPCLPRLHVEGIGWPVSHEKVIFTEDYFFHILFYQRLKRVRSLSNSGDFEQ